MVAEKNYQTRIAAVRHHIARRLNKHTEYSWTCGQGPMLHTAGCRSGKCKQNIVKVVVLVLTASHELKDDADTSEIDCYKRRLNVWLEIV